MRPIRVVVVDDSAVMRILLRDALSAAVDIDVVGMAHDPYAARDMIRSLDPDVVTLDILMPNMDGLEFLDRLMRLRPLPVIMFSALTQGGSMAGLQALAAGAVDFVAKPAAGSPERMGEATAELIAKIRSAANGRAQTSKASPASRRGASAERWSAGRLVAIGASTGGVQALRTILTALPGRSPPIVIAQHMPSSFTASFARRLNAQCAVTVVEASDGAEIAESCVYVAPGGQHLLVEMRRGVLVCRIKPGGAGGHAPSVDTLFKSVAEACGSAAIGIVLTGMGRDGASGLQDIRRAGGVTAAQDEATSVIYGMPKAAVDSDGAQYELPLSRVASFIIAMQPHGRLVAPVADCGAAASDGTHS